LKEWAYAGFFFDLTAAAASHAFAHDRPIDVIAPLGFLALVLASWALRPASRKLASSAREVDRSREAASVAQLDTLPGVGPVTAQHIVEWRSRNGRFARVDQLREIDGIGERRFQQLRDLVTV